MQFDANNIPDGIHFGLPEEIYHAIPALSASGLKNLLISAPDFWARSYMNPRKDDDEAAEAGQDKWRIIGRAFHARILEGSDIFQRRFVAEFVPPKDCLRTMDDLKNAMKGFGVKASGTTKADMIAALMVARPGLPIYDVLAAQYADQHKGKSFLPSDLLDKIEISAAMIERHPQLNKCFKGGYPEVSLIWTQEIEIEPGKIETVRFKCRFDYLKIAAITDLKTFANITEKPIDDAIYSAIAGKKYHIQAAFYMDSIPEAKKAFQEGRVFASEEAAAVYGVLGKDFDSWVSRFCETPEHEFFFVFQQKGIAPLARGKLFPRGSVYRMAQTQVQDAIARFLKYRELYGVDCWVDNSEIEELDDLLFPAYIGRL